MGVSLDVDLICACVWALVLGGADGRRAAALMKRRPRWQADEARPDQTALKRNSDKAVEVGNVTHTHTQAWWQNVRYKDAEIHGHIYTHFHTSTWRLRHKIHTCARILMCAYLHANPTKHMYRDKYHTHQICISGNKLTSSQVLCYHSIPVCCARDSSWAPVLICRSYPLLVQPC